jgi:hypothetical protein
METATQAWQEADMIKDKTKEALQEGGKKINRYTEKAASKTPSLLFVAGALGSIAVSLLLQIFGKKQWSLFIAHWVPSLMMFALYNKVAKTVGAD